MSKEDLESDRLKRKRRGSQHSNRIEDINAWKYPRNLQYNFTLQYTFALLGSAFLVYVQKDYKRQTKGYHLPGIHSVVNEWINHSIGHG